MPRRSKKSIPLAYSGAVMRSSTPRRVYSSDGNSVTISGHEYFDSVNPGGSITGGVPLQNLWLSPNSLPGKLQVEARLWERFRFKSFKVHYEPIVSAATAGSLIMSYDFDPADLDLPADPSSIPLIMANRSAVLARVNSPYTFTARLDPRAERFWILPDEATSASDLRLQNQGIVTIYSGSDLTAQDYGHIAFEYVIEFFNPCLESIGTVGGKINSQPFSTSASNPLQGSTAYSWWDRVKVDDFNTTSYSDTSNYIMDAIAQTNSMMKKLGKVRQVVDAIKTIPLDIFGHGEKVMGIEIPAGGSLGGMLNYEKAMRAEYNVSDKVRRAPPGVLPTQLDVHTVSNVSDGGLYLVSKYNGNYVAWDYPVHNIEYSIFPSGSSDSGRTASAGLVGQPLPLFTGTTSDIDVLAVGTLDDGLGNEYYYRHASLTFNLRNNTPYPCYLYLSDTPATYGDTTNLYAMFRWSLQLGTFCPETVLSISADPDAAFLHRAERTSIEVPVLGLPSSGGVPASAAAKL